MELYSTLSYDLSDDAKFSYERTIRSIDASNSKFLKKNYCVKNVFAVVVWHKIRPGLWFSIERVKSYKQFYKVYYRGEYLVHEQYREWPNYGEQFYFENVFGGKRWWGMLISRGSYKKCQSRLQYFMESSLTKPILIENSEKTLLDTENINFRLDFGTGLKRKPDDMEFTLFIQHNAKKFKKD